MTRFLSNIVLEGANDIQFKNTSGANTGKIESDGNNLVLSNAVGDILLGDGASDVYIGDGTNSVDILFEVSGTISAESGAALTLGGGGGTLALGGAISLADYVSAISATGVNTIDIGTSAKPFKNIYAAHHVGGSSINYATSRGWVEDDNPLSSTQGGEFGGDFVRNGAAAENAVVLGLDPFNNKALLWKAILNTSDDNDDGGWNKDIVIPANNNIGYLSYVYFKVDFTPDNDNDGQFYHGCGTTSGQTLNLNDGSNTNPYFNNGTLVGLNNGGVLVANKWYLSVGILQAYNNSTTDTDTITGIYDVETGEKVKNGAEFKMGNNTTGQRHRTYLYYDESTDANENAYLWNPGFHAIDGSEPKIQDLVKRQVYLDDNVKAAFGTGNDLEIFHDATNSTITNATGDLKLTCAGDDVIIQAADDVDILVQGGEVSAKFGGNGGVDLYHNNVSKFSTTSAGIEVVGEVQGDTLNIDGVADISGNTQLGGTLTVGVDDTGHDVKFFGATSGASFLYDESEDGVVITHPTNDAGLEIYTVGSVAPSVSQLKVGRSATQYWGVHTVDTVARLIHRQDETDSSAMATHFEIWSNGTGNDNWQWKHGTNSGGSLATVMTLDKAGQLTVTGEVEGGSLDINGNADISGNLTGLDNVTSTNFIIGGHTIDDVDVAGEFVDSAAHLLTSAAALDKFHVLNADTTGNADTATLAVDATTLEEARAINGVDFDGSAAITITAAAGTLSGTDLKDTVVTAAGLTTIGAAGATTNIAAGDLTMYNPVNNGNPSISIGSSASESFKLSAVYESGAQGLDIVQFESFTGGSSSNDARYSFKVDETFLMQIKDAGIQIKASGALEIGNGNAILSDSSGTTTLGNIDALDATTIATIKAAVKNVIHYDFQGYATGDGSNYEMVNNLTDTNAPFEHNISLGSDGTTATTVQNIIRSGGKTMPRACTLKRWTGWAAAAGGQTAYVALFKVTPTRNDSTNLSAVLLDAFSYTALGNAKMEDFDETSFTATAIAAGDILITAMKSQSGAIHYFTSTVEVEF